MNQQNRTPDGRIASIKESHQIAAYRDELRSSTDAARCRQIIDLIIDAQAAA